MSRPTVLVVAPARQLAAWEEPLRAQGLEVVRATSRQEARTAAAGQPLSVVLVSEKLPFAGALRVIRELRKDPATREASLNSQTSLLTAREFALLQALLARPGTILSRAELERHLYGWSEEVESNAVEFLIHSVRRKLGATAIRNVRGVGWMVDRAKC